MDIALDPTLGCGQAHRWRRGPDGEWNGVIGRHAVTLRQTADGFECGGDVPRSELERYFRVQDDLRAIMGEISGRDPDMADL